MKPFLVLMVSLLSVSAHAADLVKDVRARLVDAPLVRGQFEQKKTVAGFKKPLVSKGDFLLARDQGVLWNTRTPFASTLTLTRKSLSAQQGTGGAAYHLDSTKEPALAAVNELLFALLSGDVASLQKRFKVEGALVGDAGWKLELVPTDAGLARVFKHIHLEGDGYVRQVQLDETRGDSSVITFEQLAQTPPPDATEAERLGK
ncbi:outer membrane lipoprotein carrier protein LolA [Corallococcus exercitus]|uniref:Outer membrane lipoprotein carrier protein LolA n=1 Tax=Corallococcus exercitus TaxID=2316736 RepID=A0A3A8HQ25_9BACT|nr:outer membrane lipoprotein carrier protein LolA [Corallococcus exercitus]NOK35202.1 outer membrane lipoprotein carrier protein LolA [Corallococcus exercitus]RKG73399.1 outer membrane lipoprotein carrier protein LolA [Corallococcus exercitus]